jgi:hypothetical protein
MKKKDALLIVVVAITAGVMALVISRIFLSAPKHLQQEVEVVEPISAEFKTPDTRIFNDQAINPTRLIRIGENQNQNPFE